MLPRIRGSDHATIGIRDDRLDRAQPFVQVLRPLDRVEHLPGIVA